MRHICVPAILVLLLIWTVFASSGFCLVVPMDSSDLFRASDIIVKGKVVSTECKWISDQRGNHIWTRVTILAENKLKGNPPGDQFTLEIMGGTVGDIAETVDISPSFEKGEEVVLFLKDNPLCVVGGFQGKMTVSEGKVYPDNREVRLEVFLQAIRNAVKRSSNSLSFPDENGVIVLGGGQASAADITAGTETAEPQQPRAGGAGVIAGESGPLAQSAETPGGSKTPEPAPVAADSGPLVVVGEGQIPAGEAPAAEQKIAQSPQPQVLLAAIRDAWWTKPVDVDGDGYLRSARLNWDPNVVGGAGSLVVYEKIYYKRDFAIAWTFAMQIPAHTITGTGSHDARYIDILGSQRGLYSFRIDIYRSGASTPDHSRNNANDPDLGNRRMERAADDPIVAEIRDAWWTNPVDLDGDGYKRSARLNWDTDVHGNYGSLQVLEKVYYKPWTSETWTQLGYTSTHTITGISTADARYWNIIGGARSPYDFRIDVYRSHVASPDASRGPTNDADLNDYLLESAAEDVLKAKVRDAWWTAPVDVDGDGYKRSARLNWDSDVAGPGSLSVYEKIYYKVWNTTTWTSLSQTPVHTIIGTSTADARYLAVAAAGINYYDFKIEVYRSGVSGADYARGEWNDGDLNNYPLEPAYRDIAISGLPTITLINPNPPKGSAGTNFQVYINGADFGATQGSLGKVEFFYRSGQPKISAPILSWSNTLIRCYVPVATINNYPASAGSGPVTVKTGAGTSNGYNFMVTFSVDGKRWAGTNPVVPYRIYENCGDCTGEGATIIAGANKWNAVNSRFQFQYAGSHTNTNLSRNGVNEIMWGIITTPGVVGASACWSEGGYFVEADVLYNDYNVLWSNAPTIPSNAIDVMGVAIHEVGHWLGLRDLYGDIGGGYDTGKVMCGFGTAGLMRRTLHNDDRAGILWIYGAK
jgi:hypothetical protein